MLPALRDTGSCAPWASDQPEDAFEGGVLGESIIPAGHRLKGTPQVNFGTRNANLAVNGGADLVIALEADAPHGRM